MIALHNWVTRWLKLTLFGDPPESFRLLWNPAAIAWARAQESNTSKEVVKQRLISAPSLQVSLSNRTGRNCLRENSKISLKFLCKDSLPKNLNQVAWFSKNFSVCFAFQEVLLVEKFLSRCFVLKVPNWNSKELARKTAPSQLKSVRLWIKVVYELIMKICK